AACNRSGNAPTTKSDSAKLNVADLHTRLVNLEFDLKKETLDREHDRDRLAVFVHFERIIDCKSNKFESVTTSVGLLFVRCENAAPYLDGYKLDLQIGNPANTDYSGLSLFFATKQQREMESGWLQVDVPHKIRAGAWNPVQVVVHPLTPAEVSEVSVWMEIT